MTANAMADINDLYAWNTSDAAKVNLALTMSPAAANTASFSPAIQYVFHVEQHAQFGAAGTETKIICTFTNNMSGQCWIVNKDGVTVDYVGGDFSAVAGKASDSNKVRVFAGRRSDPFFFNLGGFLNAKERVNNTAAGTDVNGCPSVTASTLPADLRMDLTTAPTAARTGSPCAINVADCFATFNTMAIVLQVDKDLLVQAPNSIISVWASTHATP